MKCSAEDILLRDLLRLVPVPVGQPLGPGDDCAAIHCGGRGRLLLLKTDCVAEDVHFLRSDDPSKVGWKALCRPLSDIAAMGGTPAQALVTFFSPPDLDSAYWKHFYRGLGRAARRFGVTIAGGEMSRQMSGIAVSIMLTGFIGKKHLLTRSGGAADDVLFVTGRLGGSIHGHHLSFIPRLEEGRWLAETIHPSAMMDLSDGLGADLPRLARASGCGFEVDMECVPCRRGSSVDAALSDGEDYELLMAIKPKTIPRLLQQWPRVFPKTPLTRIGRLIREPTSPPDWPGGWDHFESLPQR
ncbi:MAG: thiamine-phosphate kinase [Terrimicrobiaceae bacterium]|jgi:thiamine-monophosphate kinase